MVVVSGSSHPKLAAEIAQLLAAPLIPCEISVFPNTEKRLRVLGEVKNQDVALIQSLSSPVDTLVVETLLLADALERLGARSIKLIIPWLGYSLQDKVFLPGEPLSAKVIASIISHSFIERVFLLDLHNSSIPGFFSVPTEYISANQLFVEYAKASFDLKQVVVTSPDFGGLKRAKQFADALDVDMVKVEKTRDRHTNEIIETHLQGEVADKIALIYDDVIATGGTVISVAQTLKEKGAAQVYFMATHGLFVGEAIKKLSQASAVDGIVVTNSIHHEQLPERTTVLDCAALFASALQ